MTNNEAQQLTLEPQFIEDVGKYIADSSEENVDAVIEGLRLKLQHYGFAENSVLARRKKLLQQQTHLQKSLDCVKMLCEKQDSETEAIVDFSLGANVFAKARIPPAQRVSIWLGAEVMAEYELAEAKEMLETTLSKCESNLEINHDEWSKIKDCKTTIEVNVARCYNYAVEQKKRLKAQAAS